MSTPNGHANLVSYEIKLPGFKDKPVKSIEEATAELLALGLLHHEIYAVTGFGHRHLPCGGDAPIVEKFRYGALSVMGIMGCVFGSDSPAHHAGKVIRQPIGVDEWADIEVGDCIIEIATNDVWRVETLKGSVAATNVTTTERRAKLSPFDFAWPTRERQRKAFAKIGASGI